MIGLLARAARDFWHESFLLMVFNLVYAVASLPGMVLLSLAGARRDLVLGVIGVAVIFPWPLVSFGLFGSAAEAVAGRSIHLRTFFEKARASTGAAYRWGGLTLFLTAVLLANASYYQDPGSPAAGSPMGGFVSALFLVLLILWAGVQPLILAAMSLPGGGSLAGAYRAVGRASRLRPVWVLGAGSVCLLFFIAGLVILPLGLLLAFSWIAVLSIRTLSEVLDLPRSPDHPGSAKVRSG